MPAYSIGKQQKKASFVQTKQVPGVGSYNSHQKYTSKVTKPPTCVIGKSMRLKTDKIIGPGPTSYDMTKQSFFIGKEKGYHISGKQRQRIRSQGPGPGAYSIPKFFSSKYYSFGLKTQTTNKSQNLPGPGAYQTQKVKYSHAISFQHSKRPSLQSSPRYLRPGPTDYNSKNPIQFKNKFSFPKRQKFFEQQKQIKQKVKVPGPGTYSNMNINYIKKQIMAAKFCKTKRQFTEGQNIPGPGAYSPTNSAHKRSAAAIIGNSPKQIKQNNKNPGPAAYNINQLHSIKKKQPSTIFGKQQRQFYSTKQPNLGPGSYNINTNTRGHAYSMSGRNSSQKLEKVPGPLAYSPKYQSQFRKTQMTLIGKDKKFHDDSDRNPGPGTYKIQDIKLKSKTFYFPKSIRKQDSNTNPGPGAYNIKQLIGSDSSP